MTEILDDSAVSEIEARYERAEAKYLAITQGKEWWRETETPTSVIGDSLEDIPALCATVKHLRADAKLVDEYVAEVKRELGMKPNWHLSITLERYKEKVQSEVRAEMQSQLEQLRAENERLEKVIALWFGPNSCSVCGGAPLASGKPCVCGGKGTMQAEHEGLRQALYDADISGTKIQQERDSLRGTLSALNNCRNKPVCGHCNALLREAESQYQGEM